MYAYPTNHTIQTLHTHRTGGGSVSEMHCNVHSVSDVDHATLPQRVIELVGEAAPLLGLLLRINFSFICPSCHPCSPGFVFHFLIPDFCPSLVYMSVWVSPKTETEPGVYLAGASDLVRRVTKEGEADRKVPYEARRFRGQLADGSAREPGKQCKPHASALSFPKGGSWSIYLYTNSR